MQVWIVTVALLFVAVELFSWLKHFTLPLPLYIFAGAFLAIASNSEKGIGSFRFNKSEDTEKPISQVATLVNIEDSADSSKNR